MATLPPELRRVAPAAFVGERDALARRLRQGGDREGAAEVRRLRRPSAPLWALNQLAATAPDLVAEVIRAGEALRAATGAALQGGGRDLARLSSEHARLVDELTGRAPAAREARSRVWTMVRVASVDPALARALAEGSFAEEPAGGGFDGLLGLQDTAAPPDTAPPERERKVREDQARREAQARVDEAEAEVGRRRDRHERTRERASRLADQLEVAQREAEQAARELTAAEVELRAAQSNLERL